MVNPFSKPNSDCSLPFQHDLVGSEPQYRHLCARHLGPSFLLSDHKVSLGEIGIELLLTFERRTATGLWKGMGWEDEFFVSHEEFIWLRYSIVSIANSV